MDRGRLLKAESIFHDLVQCDATQRSSLLAIRCAGDDELSRLVEQLLSNDDSGMAGFLGRPAFTPPDNGAHSTGPPVPERIGKYEIVGVLGEGGMGVVYEARQNAPSRNVALKVIRTALPSRETFRRFRHEAEILAQLQHPGIAHVYDVGVASVGPADGPKIELPYFAMELVRGRSLREFAEDRQLGVRAKLALMAQVCDAVQHAHEKGVIHRDLKADNLLVEDSGQPRILDFGVARLTTSMGDSATRHTRAGEIIGTLAYMSPEQVAGDQGLVDTRSDVYSLGVILYQLLVAKLPHDLRALPLAEAARRIRDEAPPTVASVARELRGDIEIIVAKAMHKDRARRYESAAALATDLRRFIRLEPIAARSDSAVYMLRKTLRRYRWPVGASIALVVGLVGFSAYAWFQAENQRQLTKLEQAARQRAETASHDARRAEASERAQRGFAEAAAEKALAAEAAHAAQRTRAEREAQRAKAVTAFLVDTLGLADPDLTQSADMSMKSALDRAAAQVGGRFANQPESEASVRLVIGRAYASLGELEPAEEHLGRAVDIHENILDSAPETLYEALWPYLHVLDELGHPKYRARWWHLYRHYPKLFHRVNDQFAAIQFELRAQLGEKYDPQKGAPLYAEFRRIADQVLTPDDRFWLVIADFLHVGGANLALKQRPDVGRAFLRDALEIERRLLPETNTRIIRTLGELVRATLDAGMHAEAEQLTRESLGLIRRTLPETHWYMAVNRARLGACLAGQGRFDEGEKLLLDNLALIDATRGMTNASTREIVERLIDVYNDAGKDAEADLWRESLARRIVGSRQNHRPLRQLKRVFGSEHADFFEALQLFDRERTSRAGLNAMNELIRLKGERFLDSDVRSALLAESFCAVGSAVADSRGVNGHSYALLNEAERIARASDHLHPAKRALIYWNLARNQEARGQYADAERQVRDAIAIFDREFGGDDPLTVAARSLLGGCLAGQECFDDGETLLLAALERQLPAGSVDSKAAHDTLLRLIRLYQAEGRPGEALPHVQAMARARWLDWSDIKPVIAAEFVELSAALDDLRAVPIDDVDSIGPAIRRVLEARVGAFALNEPVALVYAGALFRIARRDLEQSYHPVWIPALEEIYAIAVGHLSADEPDIGSILWWLAATNTHRGSYVEAEIAARESLRIELAYNADRPAGVPTRDGMLAGALIGQGHYTEAQPMLLASFDSLFGGDAPRQPYAAACFGYTVDLFAAAGRPEEALRRVEAALRHEIERRRSPMLLYQFSYHMLVHAGLPEDLYELARAAAQVASETRENEPHYDLLVAIADYRLGRFDASLQGLERLDALPSGDALLHSTFLALTRFRLDRIDSAQETLRNARRQLEHRADAVTVQERRAIAEAERILAVE